jgi:hypothetical protein
MGRQRAFPFCFPADGGELWVGREKNTGALTPKNSQFLICPLNQSK